MRKTIFGLIGAIALFGCTGSSSETDDEVRVAPDFEEGQGQQANGAFDYPDGPFGVSKGSVITNYKFVGYVNSVVNNQTLAEIQLAEFYNPTGDGVYEEGSVLPVGAKKPTALLINVASVWCGPCNYEAANILPGLYAKYKPQGGEFLLNLADGPQPGKAATQKSLYNWTSKYDVDYPSSIDPSYKLGALFEADAFPANLIVDTRTMKIVEVIAGAPDEGGSFWNAFEKTMAGTQ